MNIIGVSVLQTNYIWIIYNHINECIVVDPGESTTILRIIKHLRLIIQAILITHHHSDHINGIDMLVQNFPQIRIYGPLHNQYKYANIIVGEGDDFILLNQKFTVLHLPGHTSDHIGFYCDPWLFCGDTIFSGGCGKIQPGLEQSMYKSILKIQRLPSNTLIFAGHEYTISNMDFMLSILPEDISVINYRNQIIQLHKRNQFIPPTTLDFQLLINPFFRINNDIRIKKSLKLFPKLTNEWTIFKELRKTKDLF